MSIEQTEMIDDVAVDQENKRLILLLTDHFSWDGAPDTPSEEDHLLLLQRKINTYGAYWEEKKYKETFPDADVDAAVIQIHFQSEITEACLQLLQAAKDRLESHGIKIETQLPQQKAPENPVVLKTRRQKPTLKEIIQEESHTNPVFQKGRRYVQALTLIYIAIQFSDWVVSPMLEKIPFELSSQSLFGLLTALCIGYLAMTGSVKSAGFLCLLTPVSNAAMIVNTAKSYTGGFWEMMRAAPTVWYVLVISILCAIVGVWFLVDQHITLFGKRRRALQRQYVLSLKE